MPHILLCQWFVTEVTLDFPRSNVYVTLMIEIREYLCSDGSSPFADWFDSLDTQGALKVNVYITHIGTGNTSSLKSIGGGVYECRIDWGPGYRVYLGKDGEKLIILLGGGTKRRQQADIDRAKQLWAEYKRKKKAKEKQ
jgi:putative addiction module killer protein